MSDQSKSQLSDERAREILFTHGADVSRWPDEFRQALLARLDADSDLAELFADITQLDGLLDEVHVAPPSLALQTRILKSRTNEVGKTVWRSLLSVLWPYGSAAVPAGALLASAIMGGVVGVMANAGVNTTSEVNEYQVVALALGESFSQEESP